MFGKISDVKEKEVGGKKKMDKQKENSLVYSIRQTENKVENPMCFYDNPIISTKGS